LWTTVAVALGGALGSVARYGVAVWMQSSLGPNAWGTFAVNGTGSFLLGLLVGLTAFRVPLHPAIRDGLTVGVLGGYTTFSTLMYQSFRQFELGSTAAAVFNIAGSIAVGLAATFVGLTIGRAA
jgi:fluoride exporter